MVNQADRWVDRQTDRQTDRQKKNDNQLKKADGWHRGGKKERKTNKKASQKKKKEKQTNKQKLIGRQRLKASRKSILKAGKEKVIQGS